MEHETKRDAAPLKPESSAISGGHTVRRGRTRYSRKLAEIICRRLAGGERLRAIARDPAMPSRKTLHRWMKRDVDGLFAACSRQTKPGCPSTYTTKLGAEICRRLAKGEPLAAIARHPRMPPRSTLRYWMKKDKDGLFAQCPRTPGKGGPRTLYSKRLGSEICRRLASGRSLLSIAADPGMPAAPTVVDWVNKDVNGFGAAYARARELGYHAMADEILEIADDGTQDWKEVRGKGRRLDREHLARARLRVSARAWLFAKARPYHERSPLRIEIVRFSGEPVPDC